MVMTLTDGQCRVSNEAARRRRALAVSRESGARQAEAAYRDWYRQQDTALFSRQTAAADMGNTFVFVDALWAGLGWSNRPEFREWIARIKQEGEGLRCYLPNDGDASIGFIVAWGRIDHVFPTAIEI